MTIEITPGEVDRRVTRLETEVVRRLEGIADKLDHAVVGRGEYDAHRSATVEDIDDLRGRIREQGTELRARVDSLVARLWWLAGTVAALTLSAISAFIALRKG